VRDVASELVWLRRTFEFLFLLSAGTYIYVFFITPIPLSRGFFADTWDGMFLKWDETFVFLGSAGWILLCFRDLNTGGGGCELSEAVRCFDGDWDTFRTGR
jgi:hypothetical protein